MIAHGLSVLSGFRSAFRKEPHEILDPIVQALANPSPWVRINASWALGNLGAASAIPELEIALALERDEGVRVQIEVDLRILERKASTKRTQ